MLLSPTIPLSLSFGKSVLRKSPGLGGKSLPIFPVGFQVFFFVLAVGCCYYLLFSLLLPVPKCCLQLRHLLPPSQGYLAPRWIPFCFLPPSLQILAKYLLHMLMVGCKLLEQLRCCPGLFVNVSSSSLQEISHWP